MIHKTLKAFVERLPVLLETSCVALEPFSVVFQTLGHFGGSLGMPR